MSGNGMHGKQSADEYIRELSAELAAITYQKVESERRLREVVEAKRNAMLKCDDGTANTEYCDCDKIEKDCLWYLPMSLGFIVLAYAAGFVTAMYF